MKTGIDDDWTIWVRCKIDECHRISHHPGYTSAEKRDAQQGILDWQTMIKEHLAWKAADSCNVIQFHHYSRNCAEEFREGIAKMRRIPD